MAKKIILGILFLGLVGVLAMGAVNRTAAKSADTNTTEQRGAGWARAQEESVAQAANLPGRGGQGSGRSQALAEAETHTPGQGCHGQRQPQAAMQRDGRNSQGDQNHGGQGQAGSAQGNTRPYAETESHEWVTLTGAVTSIDDAQLVVQTGNGEIVIADRPWSFALAAGFTAQVGDQVTLDGFYEDGDFKAGRLTNGEQVAAIRQDSGQPLWAGAGRGRGRTW